MSTAQVAHAAVALVIMACATSMCLLGPPVIERETSVGVIFTDTKVRERNYSDVPLHHAQVQSEPIEQNNALNNRDDKVPEEVMGKDTATDPRGASESLRPGGGDADFPHSVLIRNASSAMDTNDLPHIHFIALRGYPQYYAGNIWASITNGLELVPAKEYIPDSCKTQRLETTPGNFMVLDVRRDVKYVSITKTGSSTVANRISASSSLKNNAKWVGDVEWMQSKYREFMFTYLREPLSRFCSAYGAALKKVKPSKRAAVKRIDNDPLGRLWGVLDNSLTNWPFVFERHMLQQYYFLVGPNNYTHAFNLVLDSKHMDSQWYSVMARITQVTMTKNDSRSNNVNEAPEYKEQCTNAMTTIQRKLDDGEVLLEIERNIFNGVCEYLKPEYECLGYPVPPLLKHCQYEHGDWAIPFDQNRAVELLDALDDRGALF